MTFSNILGGPTCAFRGFPEVEGTEDTDQKVLDLVNHQLHLDSPIVMEDIEASHRLGPRADSAGNSLQRAVIVRFRSRRVRDLVYRARVKLKDFNQESEPNARLYINEDLTAKRAKLLWECRKVKKLRRIGDCWSFMGKIFIKEPNGTIKGIRKTTDLQRYS